MLLWPRPIVSGLPWILCFQVGRLRPGDRRQLGHPAMNKGKTTPKPAWLLLEDLHSIVLSLLPSKCMGSNKTDFFFFDGPV